MMPVLRRSAAFTSNSMVPSFSTPFGALYSSVPSKRSCERAHESRHWHPRADLADLRFVDAAVEDHVAHVRDGGDRRAFVEGVGLRSPKRTSLTGTSKTVPSPSTRLRWPRASTSWTCPESQIAIALGGVELGFTELGCELILMFSVCEIRFCAYTALKRSASLSAFSTLISAGALWSRLVDLHHVGHDADPRYERAVLNGLAGLNQELPIHARDVRLNRDFSPRHERARGDGLLHDVQ